MKHMTRKEAIDRLYKIIEPESDKPERAAVKNMLIKAAGMNQPEQKVNNG